MSIKLIIFSTQIIMDKRRRSSILKLNKSKSSDTDVTEQLSPKVSRRVSFAASNFIKPFATDPDKNTIWDTTYEEVVNHTDSIQDQIGETKEIGVENPYESISMELEDINYSTNIEINNQISIINQENIYSTAGLENNEDIDKKISSSSLKKSQNLPNIPIDKENIPEIIISQNLPNIPIDKENIPEIIISNYGKNSKNKSKHRIQSDTGETISLKNSQTLDARKNLENANESDMELTTQLPVSNKIFSNIDNHNKENVNLASKIHQEPFIKIFDNNETVNESDMDITCQIIGNECNFAQLLNPTLSVCEKTDKYDMEFTCRIPMQPLSMVQSKYLPLGEMATVENNSDNMEFTCNLPFQYFPLNQKKSPRGSNMKFDCQISNEAPLQHPSPINRVQENESLSLDNMEFTCNLPFQYFPLNPEGSNTKVDCQISNGAPLQHPSSINREQKNVSLSSNLTKSSIKAHDKHSSSMNFEKEMQLSSAIQSKHLPLSEMAPVENNSDNMELTCNLPFQYFPLNQNKSPGGSNTEADCQISNVALLQHPSSINRVQENVSLSSNLTKSSIKTHDKHSLSVNFEKEMQLSSMEQSKYLPLSEMAAVENNSDNMELTCNLPFQYFPLNQIKPPGGSNMKVDGEISNVAPLQYPSPINRVQETVTLSSNLNKSTVKAHDEHPSSVNFEKEIQLSSVVPLSEIAIVENNSDNMELTCKLPFECFPLNKKKSAGGSNTKVDCQISNVELLQPLSSTNRVQENASQSSDNMEFTCNLPFQYFPLNQNKSPGGPNMKFDCQISNVAPLQHPLPINEVQANVSLFSNSNKSSIKVHDEHSSGMNFEKENVTANITTPCNITKIVTTPQILSRKSPELDGITSKEIDNLSPGFNTCAADQSIVPMEISYAASMCQNNLTLSPEDELENAELNSSSNNLLTNIGAMATDDLPKSLQGFYQSVSTEPVLTTEGLAAIAPEISSSQSNQIIQEKQKVHEVATPNCQSNNTSRLPGFYAMKTKNSSNDKIDCSNFDFSTNASNTIQEDKLPNILYTEKIISEIPRDSQSFMDLKAPDGTFRINYSYPDTTQELIHATFTKMPEVHIQSHHDNQTISHIKIADIDHVTLPHNETTMAGDLLTAITTDAFASISNNNLLMVPSDNFEKSAEECDISETSAISLVSCHDDSIDACKNLSQKLRELEEQCENILGNFQLTRIHFEKPQYSFNETLIETVERGESILNFIDNFEFKPLNVPRFIPIIEAQDEEQDSSSVENNSIKNSKDNSILQSSDSSIENVEEKIRLMEQQQKYCWKLHKVDGQQYKFTTFNETIVFTVVIKPNSDAIQYINIENNLASNTETIYLHLHKIFMERLAPSYIKQATGMVSCDLISLLHYVELIYNKVIDFRRELLRLQRYYGLDFNEDSRVNFKIHHVKLRYLLEFSFIMNNIEHLSDEDIHINPIFGKDRISIKDFKDISKNCPRDQFTFLSHFINGIEVYLKRKCPNGGE